MPTRQTVLLVGGTGRTGGRVLQGDVSEYTLHEGLVSSVFAPNQTNMANVAHFMCELVTSPKAWADWNGKVPVIINATPSKVATSSPARQSHQEACR